MASIRSRPVAGPDTGFFLAALVYLVAALVLYLCWGTAEPVGL